MSEQLPPRAATSAPRERRADAVLVKMTAAEKAAIADRARLAGVPVATYMRLRALGVL
jgi:hypothetical protein